MDLKDVGTKGVSPAFRLAVRFAPYIYLSIRNYIRRPRLKISFRVKSVLFDKKDKSKAHYSFPCIVIENNSDTERVINPASIYINRESYSVCVQRNAVFSLCLEGTQENIKLHCLDPDNAVVFFQKNWLNISQDISPPIHVAAHGKTIFPLYPHKEGSHFIVSTFENSKLWFKSRKVSLRMKVNSVDVEYGIDRRQVYETVINWLAFGNAEAK